MRLDEAEADRRITEALQAVADAVEAGQFASSAQVVGAQRSDGPVQWLGDVAVVTPAPRRRRQRYVGVAVAALACCALVFVSLALFLDRGGRNVPPARPTTACSSSSVTAQPSVSPSVSPSLSPPGSEPLSPSVLPVPSTLPGEPTCTPPTVGSGRTSGSDPVDAGPS